jgi:hypothetical protein
MVKSILTAALSGGEGVGRAMVGKSNLLDNSVTGASSANDNFNASGGKLEVDAEDNNKLVRQSECIGGYCHTWTVCRVVGDFLFNYSSAC